MDKVACVTSGTCPRGYHGEQTGVTLLDQAVHAAQEPDLGKETLVTPGPRWTRS
jgi:hypothetical protein